MVKTRKVRKARKSTRKTKMWGGNPTKELIMEQKRKVILAMLEKDDYYRNNMLYKKTTDEQNKAWSKLLGAYNTELIKLHEMVNKYVDTQDAEYHKNAKKHKEDLETFLSGTY